MNETDTFAALRSKGFVQGADGFWSKRPRANPDSESPRQAPELERDTLNGALGARQVQATATGRFLVRITSVRKRLLDYDNLCEKYHIDCLRYSGLLPGDGPGQTEIETRQEKAESGSGEEVIIEIFRI
jgi:hypothetical protein